MICFHQKQPLIFRVEWEYTLSYWMKENILSHYRRVYFYTIGWVRIHFYTIGWRLPEQSHLSISVIERGWGTILTSSFPLSAWIAAINPFSFLIQVKVIMNRFMIIVSYKLIKTRSRHSLMISFLIFRFLSSEQCQAACIPLWYLSLKYIPRNILYIII